MRIYAEYERFDPPRQRRDHKVCERNIVPAGCESAAKGYGVPPVFPAWLEIMGQPQARGHPVCLVGPAKPAENFREDWPRKRDPAFIEEIVHGTLFMRPWFRKKRGPNARVN